MDEISNIDIEPVKASSIIYRSRAKKEIPVPEMPFELFYTQEVAGKQKYKTIADVLETTEWKTIYSNYYDFEDSEHQIIVKESKEDIEKYSPQRQTQEMIRCANSFAYFCTKYAKINHPIFGLINFIPYTYQKRVINCYGKHRFNILSKFRQGGLTTVSVLWALWRCLFKTSQRIMVVSKTDREAIAAGEVAKTALEHLPFWLKPETDKFNEHEKQFLTTSSVLWFYTVEAARGKSITILIIDEAAFINDMHKHWKSLYPVLSTGGSCEVISTVNGQGNWYEEWYHQAEKGKNPFNIIELDYWEHPLYNDPRWVEDTKAILGEKGWAQEIERSFLGSGDAWINSAIRAQLIEDTKENYPARMAFSQWRNKDSKKYLEYDEGALWIWKERVDGHEYIIGVDCAAGVGDDGDMSAFQIIDQVTLEQVAEFYSNTIPPHIFSQILNEIGYYYNTALIVVENLNEGCAVLTVLQHELAYENLYYEDTKQQNAGIKTNKNKRPQFLQCLQQRLMNGTIKINSCRFVDELNTFIFNPISKRPEAQRGKHDDAILSIAIALYVRESQNRSMPVGMDMPNEMLQIFNSNVYKEIKNEILTTDFLEEFLNEKDSNEDAFFGEFNRMNPVETRKFKRKNDAQLREFGW